VGEPGSNRAGALLCRACRDKPGSLLEARVEAGDVPAIKGYSILHKLGEGGMGVVWLARRERNGERAAIKVMLPRVAADERAINRFLREMNSNRVLAHPNVVQLLHAGYSHGTFFLVLEYCAGGSVAGLMKRRGGTLPVGEAVAITLAALDGLHYAHNVFGPGKGLVHRDVKPANLLLAATSGPPLARVGDFGLAKAFEEAAGAT
jgi:serine/threonine protein kinase